MIVDGVRIDLGDELVEQVARRVAAIIGERNSPDPLLSVKEAADYLRCKPKRIHELCSMGRLRYEKDGRRSLIRRSAIDEHLEGGAP